MRNLEKLPRGDDFSSRPTVASIVRARDLNVGKVGPDLRTRCVIE